MELRGLRWALQIVKEQGTVTHFITDRHASVKKHMKDHEPAILHHFDIWHMAKGMYVVYLTYLGIIQSFNWFG